MTSAGLVLASVWPRDAILIEADPSGGDLALRCTTDRGQPCTPTPNVLGLAAATREGRHPGALLAYSQRLGGGANLVPGVASPTQATSVAGLWSSMGRGIRSSVDVLVDAGRVHDGSAQLALAGQADVVVVVCQPSPESYVHVRAALTSLVSTLARVHSSGQAPTLVPLLVDRDRYAAADAHDLDAVLANAGIQVEPTQVLSHDWATLDRLQRGERLDGRLGRTSLARTGRTVVEALLALDPHDTRTVQGVAADGVEAGVR